MNAKLKLVENQPKPSGQWVKRDSSTGQFMSTKLIDIAADPLQAAAFLKAAGIITKSGKLTAHYNKKR